jgi:YspA, cpYpsA-related SLOG family
MIIFGQTRFAIVCGGRTYGCQLMKTKAGSKERPGWWEEREHLFHVLDAAVERLGMEAIVEGGATGADNWAHVWAATNGIPSQAFPADWRKYGRGAGPIRNMEMLETAKPFCVIAFPGGAGTEHMKTIARDAGITVYEC